MARTYADFQQLHLESFCRDGHRPLRCCSSKTLLTFFYKGKAVSCVPHEPEYGRICTTRFGPFRKAFWYLRFPDSRLNISSPTEALNSGDPDSLETGVTGIQRTNIYYCDPMRSGQKGRH